MSGQGHFDRAEAALQAGDRTLARRLLGQALEEQPENLRAGLVLARLECEDKAWPKALELLGELWRRTRAPEAGDALAEAGLAAARDLESARREDRKVVERLAGLLRALNGPNKILVDALQYDIIGGLAIDSMALIPVVKAGIAARTGKSVAFFSGKSANPALVEMIARELPVVRDEEFPQLMPFCSYDWDAGRFSLSPEFARVFFGRHAELFAELVEFTHSTNGRTYLSTPEDERIFTQEEPQIYFTPEEQATGERFLREVLGLPEDGWFVCVYARDGGYYNETPASPNWFRNSDIRTFLPTVDEILARGGHVVRIGERANQALTHGDPRFLDYSRSAHRTPLLDLYLLATCRFLLGTPSGLCHVAYAFGTPELMVNTVNLCTINSVELYIPKRMRDTQTGQPLHFAQYLERLYGYGNIGLFLENGNAQRELLHVEYEDNTPEDIRRATVEMFERMAGRHGESASAAELRRRFRPVWQRWAPNMADTVLASSYLDAHPELFA